MIQRPPDELLKTLVKFCRFARANGLNAGVKQTIDSLEVARAVAGTDWEAFRFALRAALCSSKEEWELFDNLFEVFWRGTGSRPGPASTDRATIESARANGREEEDSFGAVGESAGPALEGEDEARAVSGASVNERVEKTDFSRVPQSDLAALERISSRLVRQMSWRVSRRLKIMESRGQMDLRRTIRRSVSRGGHPIDLLYRGKKIKPAKLVTCLDVSGSMNLYSLFLLKFIYALQKYFKRVESFLVSTKLVKVTEALKAQALPDALKALSETPSGWCGGTRIGESLREFNLLYGRKLLSRDTLFIILSDGWDTGEPETLAAELSAIKRRVRKLIWLNPLLGLDNYQPITRGMSAALPYVDVFAAAHNLASLLELEGHLRM